MRHTLSFPGTCRLRTTSGECCVPFTYRSRRYRGCARHRNGRTWCYTTPDYRRKRLWGWCRGGKRRKLFIEDFVQRKADTKLCFPWRPLSHFSCCPTKALMVLKIDSLFVSAFSLSFSVEILNVRARADWAEKLSLVCARKNSTSCHHGDKW